MRLVRLVLLCVTFATPLFPQNNPADGSQPATVIRSNPRLVLVNVIVTDSAGKPVHGLTQHDFTVLEDGKSQSIRSFDERSAAPDPKTPESKETARDFGPNVHTNWVQVPKNQVTNILLFDMLNMSSQDLVSAKHELLRTVQNLPAGQQFALFVLGKSLHMIQGFTWEKGTMYAAASRLNDSTTSPVYADTRTFSSQIGELKETMLIKNPKAFEALVQTLATEQDIKLESRMLYTFDGLYALARALVAVPGRKNLIWITSGFPFDASRGDMDRFTHLSSLLSASQIAVYPIDARGVVVGQPDAATRDSELFAPAGDIVGPWLAGLDEEQRTTYETMSELAAQTGGRAFFNQNAFLPVISKIVEAGANYYTLAYRPTNSKWNGTFRKIQVKTPRRDIKLLYRTGYYALADPLQLPRPEDRERALQIAMLPSAPPSTTLIIKTRVVPPDNGATPVKLDYLVDVTDLATSDQPTKKKGINVVFEAIATDAQGHVAASCAWNVKQDLTESELQQMRRRGLQIHQDFPLKAGDYQIRLGVLDRNSGKVGTLDVPVTIAQVAPTK